MKLHRVIALAFALLVGPSVAWGQGSPGTSPLSILKGGTGGGTVAAARTNLGITATGADTTYNFRANNLSDVANAGTARSNLGLAIGSNVQAFSAILAAMAGLTGAADKIPYFTGASAMATADFGLSIRTWFTTPSSANLRGILSDETGTGPAVFGTAPTIDGLLNVSGAVKFSTQSAPAQITSNQNDYNPSSVNCATSTTLLINSDAARDITGLAGGVAGCEMRLVNNGSFAITLKEQNASSTAGNRFNTGADLSLAPSAALTLLYDGTASRWRLTSLAPAAGAGTGTVTSVVCGTGLDGGTITTSGTCSLAAARRTLPTVTPFLTGSGTYNTPANVLWIELELIGAGSGGAGGNGTASTLGGNTCWNTSGAACTTPVYQAGGAAAAPAAGTSAVGAVGGTVSGSGSCNVLSVSGGNGDSATLSVSGVNAGKGGMGGSSSIGGNGGGGNNSTGVGSNAKTNSGSGGGGGGQGGATSAQGGSGGAAGATCRVILNSPAASYTYAVGAGGNGGTGGTSGANGGDGAAGHIVVIEHYGT